MVSGTSVKPALAMHSGPPGASAQNVLMLFLASFLAPYFELVVIRYLSTEIRVFAYLKNLALVAASSE